MFYRIRLWIAKAAYSLAMRLDPSGHCRMFITVMNGEKHLMVMTDCFWIATELDEDDKQEMAWALEAETWELEAITRAELRGERE